MPPWSPEEAWSAWDIYQDANKRANNASVRASKYLDRLIEEKRKSNYFEAYAVYYHGRTSFWERLAEELRLDLVRESDLHDKAKSLCRRYKQIADRLAGRRISHAEALQRKRQLWRFSERSLTQVEDDLFQAYTEIQAADGNQSAIDRLLEWRDEMRGDIRTEQ